MACIKNDNQLKGRSLRDGVAIYLSNAPESRGGACVEATGLFNRAVFSGPPVRAKLFPTSEVGIRIFLTTLLLIFGPGCSSFSNGKLLKQLQNDNERLLSEFRAERTRREEAERAAMQLEQRLAESEKLLARQSGTPGPQRISSLQSGSRLPATSGSLPFGSTGPTNGGANSEFETEDTFQNFQWQRRYK